MYSSKSYALNKGDIEMIKYNRIAIAILTIFFLVSMIPLVRAAEPRRPTVDYSFDSEKEEKIQELSRLPLTTSFKRLKSDDFVIDNSLLDEAIFNAFNHRRAEAINFTINNLRLPAYEIINGKIVSRSNDIHVAKKTLEVFPDEAVDGLLKAYRRNGAVTKGNIIRVSGNLAKNNATMNLLIEEALYDKTFCEEEYPEMPGEPLRICDVAYNQLVLWYKIKNVLRTIGNTHRIEVRDYHINELKSRL